MDGRAEVVGDDAVEPGAAHDGLDDEVRGVGFGAVNEPTGDGSGSVPLLREGMGAKTAQRCPSSRSQLTSKAARKRERSESSHSSIGMTPSSVSSSAPSSFPPVPMTPETVLLPN